MKPSISSNRAALDASPTVRRWFSPDTFSLDQKLLPVLRERATGDLLDAGCGAMPYRDHVGDNVTSYDGLDLEPRSDDVKYVCSVTDMSAVQTTSYDTVLCSEVLEHVGDPAAAVREFARVLRPGGTLLVTVPFLGRLHEEPHDFQRFTEHGLRLLLSDCGFEVVQLEPTGTVGSFLGHQVSSALVLPTWNIPIVKWIAFGLNAVLVVVPSLLIDLILRPIRRKLPLGYVVVATKT